MRVLLTGTKKEMPIIEPIFQGVASTNVFVAAGKTNIPQLAALLQLSDLLITGDTGPMHISVAAGTPVLSMFLASAFGFETGPYSEDNIVLQPVIACGPCNPNKPCTRPDCHDCIEPQMLADLAIRMVSSNFRSLPQGYADPKKLIIYRSYFDQFGFCDFEPLTSDIGDPWVRCREAYRKVWLSDLAGCEIPFESGSNARNSLAVRNGDLSGLSEVIGMAEEGIRLIDELCFHVKNTSSPPEKLAKINSGLTELDRQIEHAGYHYAPLGPLTRMFIFAKENIVGTEALSLASQMKRNYEALKRRGEKLGSYYQATI